MGGGVSGASDGSVKMHGNRSILWISRKVGVKCGQKDRVTEQGDRQVRCMTGKIPINIHYVLYRKVADLDVMLRGVETCKVKDGTQKAQRDHLRKGGRLNGQFRSTLPARLGEIDAGPTFS